MQSVFTVMLIFWNVRSNTLDCECAVLDSIGVATVSQFSRGLNFREKVHSGAYPTTGPKYVCTVSVSCKY